MKLKEKKKKDIKGWLVENKNAFIFLVIGIIIGVAGMLPFWPSRIAKLKNGEEPIVSVDGLTITADSLYAKLKETNGINAIIEEIDKEILSKEYNIDEEAEKNAKQNAETYYKQYESYYGYTKEQFLTSNGFEKESDFIDYLKNEYIASTYYKDYLKTLISEKDIEKFYKKEAFGTKKVTIFSEEENKNLDDVRKELKKNTAIDKINEKFEDVKSNQVTIGINDIGSYSDKIIENVRNMKKGDYSKVISDETYGYVVIYVSDTEDLGALDTVKEDIITTISARLDSEDSNLYNKAYDKLRNKYNLKFSDTEMAKKYKTIIKQ